MTKKIFREKNIVAVLLWLGAALIMFMSQEYMTDGLFLTALVLVVGGIEILGSEKFKLAYLLRPEQYKGSLWIPIVSVYFLLALSWGRMFENPLWDVYLELGLARRIFVYGFLYVMVPLGVLISACVIMDHYVLKLRILKVNAELNEVNKNLKTDGAKEKEKSPIYLGPFLALAVISFIFIFAAYPGLSEPDGWGLWNWVQNGVYDEWHTIGYLLFVKLCSLICNSLFTVEIANVLLFLVASFWAMKLLSQSQICSSRILWGYVIANVLLVSPLMYLQGMNKDTVYNICLFGSCIAIYLLVGSVKRSRADLVFSVIFLLGAAIFRHGGLFFCELALFITFIYLRRKKLDMEKIAVFYMATTAIGYFIIVILVGRCLLQANPNPPYVKYSVPMYMMGAMASDEEVELSSQQEEVYELFAPVDTWRSAHTRYYADPVSREWGPVLSYPTPYPESVYGPAIIKTNFQLLVKYPGKYLKNYLDETSILWEITRPQDGMEVALTPTLLGSERYANDTASVKSNGFTAIVREYADFASRLPIYRSIVWRGGFAQFCYIVLICLAGKKKRGKFVLVLLPLMLYYLSLYLSIPAQATRYIVGAVEMLPFFAELCYLRCVNEQSD